MTEPRDAALPWSMHDVVADGRDEHRGVQGPGVSRHDGGPTRGARLRGWWSPTPAEVVGVAVLLLGSVVAAVLWWYPTVTAPGGARADRPVGAAEVGAAVEPDGRVLGPAPGVEDPQGPTTGTAGVADGSRTDVVAGPQPAPGPAGTSALTVHVTGGVAVPGLVTLPGDARIGDAVQAAGGVTTDADLERINLARVLVDGEHVHVPRVGEDLPPSTSVPEQGGVGGDGLVDLNLATAAELETLPGIGPTRAAAIVQYREQHGPFATPGDLRAVSGIGEVTFQNLAPLVVVR